MPKVHITHKVKDVAAWKAFDGERDEIIGALASDIVSYTDPEGGDTVGLTMNVPDMDALGAFMESPEAAVGMQKHGVLPETMRILVA